MAGSAAAVLWSMPSLVMAKLYGSPVTYDYVASGVVKGSQTTRTLPDGSLDVSFEYIDRGRGPKLHSVIGIGPAGLIARLQTSGYNYLKVSVNERFSTSAGAASWKNAVEDEAPQVGQPRFYASIDGTPEELAILTRAALTAADATLPLWPSGNAVVRKVRTFDLTVGSEARTVTMYEILGLHFSPTAIWLDADGSLFCYGSEWGAVVPTGWSGSLSQLLRAQNDRTSALGRQYATTLAQHAATAIAITGVSLFDSEAGTIVRDATVLINGENFVAVGDRGVSIPSDARHIDGAGKTLLPGLWNSHMHVSADYGPRLLAEGVTTIRDPGNPLERITTIKRQFDSGELIGPRVVIAGLMDGTGKYTAPIGTTTGTAAGAIDGVRAWKHAGALQIKIYSSMDPQLVPLIVKEAHALNMRVSGHIPAGMLAEDAVRAGYDEIQHINFLFLNFMPDTKDQTQTPVRLTATAARAGTVDLDSAAVSDFIALLKAHDIVSDPTVSFFNYMTLTRPGDMASTGFADIADWLPMQVRRGLTSGGLPQGPEFRTQHQASAQAYEAMLALLHHNEIRIVAGTDDVLPGLDLVRELTLYAQAGIPNANVLQAATIVPARVMKMDDRLGSVRTGKLADAIVVRGNPLAEIGQLRRVETTIKGGVLYDSRALYATAGIAATPLT